MRSRCVCSRTGKAISTRRKKLRSIQSALARYSSLRAVVAEVEHARVLEEAADDRAHADVLRNARDARPQRAQAADDEVDLHAGARGAIQRLDDLRIHQRIHLGDDAAGRARRGVLGFAVDLLDHRCRAGRTATAAAWCSRGVCVRLVSCRNSSCTSWPISGSQVNRL